MKKEEFAALLNERPYRDEMSKEEEKIAKESNLIIISGASDDLIEFRGALNDELGMYNGGDFIIATPGMELPADESEETYYKVKELEVVGIESESTEIKNRFSALWSPDTPDCSWLIKTNLPHATFDILEGGELYCRGIVICVSDLIIK